MKRLTKHTEYTSQIQSAFNKNETFDNNFVVLGHTPDQCIVTVTENLDVEHIKRLKEYTINEITNGEPYLENEFSDPDFALYAEDNIVIYEYSKREGVLLTCLGFKVTDIKPLD